MGVKGHVNQREDVQKIVLSHEAYSLEDIRKDNAGFDRIVIAKKHSDLHSGF